jgi:hypothetical protein
MFQRNTLSPSARLKVETLVHTNNSVDHTLTALKLSKLSHLTRSKGDLTLKGRRARGGRPLCTPRSTWGRSSRCASCGCPGWCPCQSQWPPPDGPCVALRSACWCPADVLTHYCWLIISGGRCYLATLSVCRVHSVRWWCDWYIGNDLEGNGRGLIEIKPFICLERLKKSIKGFNHDRRCPVRDLNQAPPEDETKALAICQRVLYVEFEGLTAVVMKGACHLLSRWFLARLMFRP